MKKILLLFGLVILLTACKQESAEAPTPVAALTAEELAVELLSNEALLRVNHYQIRCTGVAEQNCYLVQEGKQLGTDEWLYFYNEIKGFVYQEGFVYLLKVRIDPVDNPPIDGSDRDYVLLEVLSKKQVK